MNGMSRLLFPLRKLFPVLLAWLCTGGFQSAYAQCKNIQLSYPSCPCTSDGKGRRADCYDVNQGGYQTCWSNANNITCPRGIICPYDSYGTSTPCGDGGGGGGGCCGPQPAVLVVLQGGLPARADLLRECPYRLDRTLPGPEPGMYYTMDEWAIYSTSDVGLQTRSASSSSFAQGILPCIEKLGLSNIIFKDDFLIIIGFPPMPPKGHRWTIPALDVDGVIPIPPDISPLSVPARAVFRMEWDEWGNIAQADLLHITRPVPDAGRWAEVVVRHMRLRLPTDGSMSHLPASEPSVHRFVAYLVVDGKGSFLQVSNLWTIVPLCCCGERCCI
jgi:hypothetical protein